MIFGREPTFMNARMMERETLGGDTYEPQATTFNATSGNLFGDLIPGGS